MIPATGNGDLAAHARALADRPQCGAMDRKAALCVAVCLQTTKTLGAARKALAEIRIGPVRKAATELFDHITTEET